MIPYERLIESVELPGGIPPTVTGSIADIRPEPGMATVRSGAARHCRRIAINPRGLVATFAALGDVSRSPGIDNLIVLLLAKGARKSHAGAGGHLGVPHPKSALIAGGPVTLGSDH